MPKTTTRQFRDWIIDKLATEYAEQGGAPATDVLQDVVSGLNRVDDSEPPRDIENALRDKIYRRMVQADEEKLKAEAEEVDDGDPIEHYSKGQEEFIRTLASGMRRGEVRDDLIRFLSDYLSLEKSASKKTRQDKLRLLGFEHSFNMLKEK